MFIRLHLVTPIEREPTYFKCCWRTMQTVLGKRCSLQLVTQHNKRWIKLNAPIQECRPIKPHTSKWACNEKARSFLKQWCMAIIFLMFIIKRMYPATFPNVSLEVNLATGEKLHRRKAPEKSSRHSSQSTVWWSNEESKDISSELRSATEAQN